MSTLSELRELVRMSRKVHPSIYSWETTIRRVKKDEVSRRTRLQRDPSQSRRAALLELLGSDATDIIASKRPSPCVYISTRYSKESLGLDFAFQLRSVDEQIAMSKIRSVLKPAPTPSPSHITRTQNGFTVRAAAAFASQIETVEEIVRRGTFDFNVARFRRASESSTTNRKAWREIISSVFEDAAQSLRSAVRLARYTFASLEKTYAYVQSMQSIKKASRLKVKRKPPSQTITSSASAYGVISASSSRASTRSDTKAFDYAPFASA